MSSVIKVEGLSKRYIIGHQRQESYNTLRDAIAQGATRFGKRLMHPFRSSSGQPLMGVDEAEEFWALKDVSLEVNQGDRIGIIGRNGAGKSTLLKILSRITEPTNGRITIKGRVASLLEVGTGFHPELSGRENIFLNGAVLGMGKTEIIRKFDEIVAFSGVEKFLDTPVKRYSSGMYVRLAFAVAAHLEPEILIVDEVLAVGDYVFQKKCLGKMEEVGKEGRTVIFVSHNLGAVKTLCDKAHVLNHGQLVHSGNVSEALNKYKAIGVEESANAPASEKSFDVDPELPLQILKAEVVNDDGDRVEEFDLSEGPTLLLTYEVREKVQGAVLSATILKDGDVVFVTWDTDEDESSFDMRERGCFSAKVKLRDMFLKEGMYSVNLSVGRPNASIIQNLPNSLQFNVVEKGAYTSVKSYAGKRAGNICMPLRWGREEISRN